MTPEYLGEKITEIDVIRMNLFCDVDADSGFDPFAYQHFLGALNALDDAKRQLTLAQLHQTRAIAARRGQR